MKQPEVQLDIEGWLMERSSFGWLGRPPIPLQDMPPQVSKKWKALSKRAEKVASMSPTAQKVNMAKRIEQERAILISAMTC